MQSFDSLPWALYLILNFRPFSKTSFYRWHHCLPWIRMCYPHIKRVVHPRAHHLRYCTLAPQRRRIAWTIQMPMTNRSWVWPRQLQQPQMLQFQLQSQLRIQSQEIHLGNTKVFKCFSVTKDLFWKIVEKNSWKSFNILKIIRKSWNFQKNKSEIINIGIWNIDRKSWDIWMISWFFDKFQLNFSSDFQKCQKACNNRWLSAY